MASINWGDFISRYKPVPNHIDDNASYDGYMFETYGKEFDHVLASPVEYVWTVIDTDDAATPIIVNGLHYVNRLGYIITAIAVPPGLDIEVDDND